MVVSADVGAAIIGEVEDEAAGLTVAEEASAEASKAIGAPVELRGTDVDHNPISIFESAPHVAIRRG